jgi:hypothetical protein
VADDAFTVDDLIEVIHRDVYRSACEDVIKAFEHPPGRKPRGELLQLSSWYASLSPEDRELLHSALAKAADAAVFGMLCLLDNVRPVTKGFHTELRLCLESGGVARALPLGDPLHDAFRWRADRPDLQWERGSNTVQWWWKGRTVCLRYPQPIRSAAVIGDPAVVVVVEPLEHSAPRNAVVFEPDGTEGLRLIPPNSPNTITGFDQVFQSAGAIEAVLFTNGADLHGEPDLATGELRNVAEWR